MEQIIQDGKTESPIEIAQALLSSLFQFKRSEWMRKMHQVADLSPVESMVLMTIGHHTHGMCEKGQCPTPSHIGELLKINSSTVTGHIGKLEEKGFITREIDRDDRRVIRVLLTEKGKQTVEQAKESTVSSFVGLVNHLGADKSLELVHLLKESSTYFSQLQ